MRIVVVGSGLAGVTFAETAAAARHDVTLLTSETLGYYSRPRLSHGMALSDEAAAKIVLKPFAALKGVKVVAGKRVEAIDELDYELLVLATGSAARIPPPLMTSQPHILTLNSLDDLLTLRRRHAKTRAEGRTAHWAVIGGGLIGCELASDLHKAGDRVTIFHRESRLLELQLDEAQSQALHEHFVARGVEVRYAQDVRGLDRHMVFTTQGDAGPFDGIIVSTGFVPRIELAKDAGLGASSSTAPSAPMILRFTPSATWRRSAASSIPSSRRSARRRYGWRHTSKGRASRPGFRRNSPRSSRCMISNFRLPPRRS
jgi:NAD(P)H-nitrite reductase large subunit